MANDDTAAESMARAQAIAETVLADPQGDLVVMLFQRLYLSGESEDTVRDRLIRAVTLARSIMDEPPQRAIIAIFSKTCIEADVRADPLSRRR
jgi:hypothetical protein